MRDAVAADAAAIAALQNALLDSTAIEWTDVPHTVEGRLEWLAHHQAAGEAVLVAVDGGAKHGRWLDLVLLQLRLDDSPPPPA